MLYVLPHHHFPQMSEFTVSFQRGSLEHAGRRSGDVMFLVNCDCLHTLCIS